MTPARRVSRLCSPRYCGTEDVAVGAASCRPHTRAELEGLIGFFVNTLVLGLIARVTRASASSLAVSARLPLPPTPTKTCPSNAWFKRSVLSVTLAAHHFFQVMFSSRARGRRGPRPSRLTCERFPLPLRAAKFDLGLTVFESKHGRLRGTFESSTELFEQATVERLADHFQHLLTSAVADPSRRLWELSMLSASERHRLLVEWNATERDYPRDQTIVDLFEEQVARTPDAPL